MTLQPSSINVDQRRIAGIMFLNFAARGLVLPFVNLYLVSVGFSGTQIGILMSVSALLQLLMTPALHTWADRTGRHRQLLYGLLTGASLSSFGLAAGVSHLWLAGTILLRDLTDLPGASLMIQLTITWLDRHQRAVFGRLRAWGSLGWAVTTLVSGRIFAAGGYPLLFALGGVCNLLLLPLVKTLPERTSAHPKRSPEARRSFAFYALMVTVFLFAVGFAAISGFGFIYFKRDLGASNELIGVMLSVTALSEIPAMILIDRLLKRTSTHITFAIGMLGQAALWVGFTLLTGSTLLIPLMMVRGTFYTFHSVSMSLLVSHISHPQNAATNQALAIVTVPGLAVLLTGSVSGWLFDHAGPRVLFQLVAVLAVAATIVVLAARRQITAQDKAMQALRQSEAAA